MTCHYCNKPAGRTIDEPQDNKDVPVCDGCLSHTR